MTPSNPYGEETGLPRLSTVKEASTDAGSVLGRIYQSLAEFTLLTGLLRAAVDTRLGERLQVTGWSDGILRVRLDQPALATRWRFQEPSVLRQLARQPPLRGLREIRLVLAPPPLATTRPRLPQPLKVPAAALRTLAENEEHSSLRRALQALAAATEAGGETAPGFEGPGQER